MLVFMKKNCCQAYVFISGIKYDNYGQTVKLTLVFLNPRLPSLFSTTSSLHFWICKFIQFLAKKKSSSNCQK